MWNCDPYRDIQRMEPRDLLRLGPNVSFNQYRPRHHERGTKEDPTRGAAAQRGFYD